MRSSPHSTRACSGDRIARTGHELSRGRPSPGPGFGEIAVTRLLIISLGLTLIGCGKSQPTVPSADQLRAQLKSPDAGSRREAAAALGRLGPDARAAVAD